MGGAPAEFAAQLRGVDGVAAVVAGAVGHPVEVVGPLAHGSENRPQHVDVAALAVGADEVRLAASPSGQDLPHGRRMVVDVDPAVELGARAVDDVGDLPGDELLHVLVGAIVVRAVGDGRPQAVRAGPGAHEHVRGGLRGAVRRARPIGRLLGEARGVVQGQFAVDLVGRDVVEANPVLANRLQQAKRPLHVRVGLPRPGLGARGHGVDGHRRHARVAAGEHARRREAGAARLVPAHARPGEGRHPRGGLGVGRDPREGPGGGLAGLHDCRADGGGPGVAVDAENGRVLRHGGLPPTGPADRPLIVVRGILGRLPRPFQGRRAGDSHAIKFASYRLI